MIFRNLLIAALLLQTSLLWGQSKSADDQAVLFTIGEKPITVEEFKYVYEKNNLNNDSLYFKEDLNNYLELYVNFKLKVAEAMALRFDTTKAFREEYEMYRSQLAKPYLSETKVTESLVKEAYANMLQQTDASHILVRFENEGDTLAAWEKIHDILAKAKSGIPFDKLAQEYSEDPSAKQNAGRLGYFSAFQMVYPFEAAAFSTPVEGISDVFSTRFGYHILKVHDRRPNPGKIRIAHIYIRQANEASAHSDNGRKMQEIYEKLKKGEDWNQLCATFSEDMRTKDEGGELPPFSAGEMPPEFEKVAFSMDTKDQISAPFESPYGWHIIKYLDKQPIEEFEAIKEQLTAQVQRDTRAQTGKKMSLEVLKNKFDFEESPENLQEMLQKADSTILQAKWSYNQSNPEEMLFSIGNKKFSKGDFANYILTNQRSRSGISPKDYMQNLYERYVEAELSNYEEKQLEKTNRDYAFLIGEYHDGLLLFDIMEQKVWSKAIEDTTGLQNFFKENQSSYYWNPRAKATIYNASNEKLANELAERHATEEDIILISQKFSDKEEVNEKALDEIYDRIKNIQKKMDGISIDLAVSGVDTALLATFERQWSSLSDLPLNLESENTNTIEKYVKLTVSTKSKKGLEYVYNNESALALQIEEGLFEQSEKVWPKEIPWEVGIHREEKGERVKMVVVDEILPAQPKSLSEVRGKVISDYQNYLEKNWLDDLKRKFPVKVKKRTLKKLYKKS
ncbi:MAG: peptidylprolyl isomerase [Cyclobacteriaceae bacterium]